MCLEKRHSLISQTIRAVCIPFCSHHLLSSVTLCAFLSPMVKYKTIASHISVVYPLYACLCQTKGSLGLVLPFRHLQSAKYIFGHKNYNFCKMVLNILSQTQFKFYDPYLSFTGDITRFFQEDFPLILDFREMIIHEE